MNESTALTPQHQSEIQLMLEHRALAIDAIAKSFDAAAEALEHGSTAAGGRLLLGSRVFGDVRYKKRDREVEAYRQELDRALWRRVFEITKLSSLMGYKQRDQFRKDLEKDVPEFNEENLRATFADVHNSAGEIFEQTVRDLFEQLRPRFKSHQGFGFGERMIFEGAMEWSGLRMYYSDILLDLMTACAVLEGQPRPKRDDGILGLVKNARERRGGVDVVPGETRDEHFRVKWFKNGNVHVWMLRDDLRQGLNRVLEGTQPDGLCAR